MHGQGAVFYRVRYGAVHTFSHTLQTAHVFQWCCSKRRSQHVVYFESSSLSHQSIYLLFI